MGPVDQCPFPAAEPGLTVAPVRQRHKMNTAVNSREQSSEVSEHSHVTMSTRVKMAVCTVVNSAVYIIYVCEHSSVHTHV